MGRDPAGVHRMAGVERDLGGVMRGAAAEHAGTVPMFKAV
jgi:hypothetical protein